MLIRIKAYSPDIGLRVNMLPYFSSRKSRKYVTRVLDTFRIFSTAKRELHE